MVKMRKTARAPVALGVSGYDSSSTAPNDRGEVIYSMRMPTDLRDALAKAAEDDDRTAASLTKAILRRWLTDHGYLKRGP